MFECGPDGADKKVCEYLARKIDPNLDVISVPLDNKPSLIEKCGSTAQMLFKQGCERVLILWDLYPPWKTKQKPCRKFDCDEIKRNLKKAGVSLDLVYLICIEQELEAWLISDGRAVSAVISNSNHPVKISDVKKSERVDNPKKVLNKHFAQYHGRPYVDRYHAVKIAEAFPDFNRVRRCPSFSRFESKLVDG